MRDTVVEKQSQDDQPHDDNDPVWSDLCPWNRNHNRKHICSTSLCVPMTHTKSKSQTFWWMYFKIFSPKHNNKTVYSICAYDGISSMCCWVGICSSAFVAFASFFFFLLFLSFLSFQLSTLFFHIGFPYSSFRSSTTDHNPQVSLTIQIFFLKIGSFLSSYHCQLWRLYLYV